MAYSITKIKLPLVFKSTGKILSRQLETRKIHYQCMRKLQSTGLDRT